MLPLSKLALFYRLQNIVGSHYTENAQKQARRNGGDKHLVKVLVVDDNKRIANLLKDALERESDIQVVGIAYDGEEALKAIGLLHPDVMLLDLIMPKIDGLGVMERLQNREGEHRPKIIVVSAISQESVTENVFELGAAYYILKPFDTRVIVSRVRAVAGCDIDDDQ